MEGATDILYHYMTTADAVRTLTDNHYSLESSTGMPAEERWQPKGKHWYLATTRSKVGDYTVRQPSTSGAMFVLDGRWIGQRYKVAPMDYWEGSNRPSDYNAGPDARTSESEDRVYSKTHSIPLHGSTTAVHVFIIPQSKLPSYSDPENLGYRAAEIRRIVELSKGRGLPVYLYDDKRKWFTQRPELSVPLDADYAKELLSGKAHEKRVERNYESDYYANIKYWVEILEKNNTADLSQNGDKLVYNMRYYNDTVNTLVNDMHNAARNPKIPDYKYVVKINQYMHKLGLSRLKDLEAYLKKKWTDIAAREKAAKTQTVSTKSTSEI